MCYCNSGKNYAICCEPILLGIKKTETAEQCMRSRYAAYCLKKIDYIVETTFPSQRKFYAKKSLESWANAVIWLKLEIISTSENQVEFKAYFTEKNSKIQIHHEKSLFKFENGNWYFYEGDFDFTQSNS